MRILVAWVLLAACAAPVRPLQGPNKPLPPVKADRRVAVTDDKSRPDWARAVAKLRWTTKKGRSGVGSAVLVSPKLAMTAHHCVKEWNGSARLLFGYDGVRRTQLESRTARRIVAKTETGDWAILELDRPVTTIRPLKMAARPVRKYGTKRMLLAGYSCDAGPGRGGLLLTYDAKCKLKKVRTDAGRLLTDAICYHGASGGPAFVQDKESGKWRWCGIVQGNINATSTRSFVTYAVYQKSYEATLAKELARAAAAK